METKPKASYCLSLRPPPPHLDPPLPPPAGPALLPGDLRGTSLTVKAHL